MNDERTWVIQAQRGNDDAFTRLVETYQTPVFNLCYRMLGEPELAEDAAQETFLRAYQHIRRYDLKRPFATWLLSIAAHHCIDRLRRRRFFSISIDDEGDDEDDRPLELPDTAAIDPALEAERREEQRLLHGLLSALNPTDRAALILRYWYDFSEVEIADALSLTVSAVKSRLFRARKQIGQGWLESSAEPEAERMPYGSPAF
ncbi:MAG: sigma-70 family RNA polymerase sigma factor [Anaerolineales bacterium]